MAAEKKIPLRLLGKTDILVTPIGLGTMQLGGGGGLIGKAFQVLSQAEKNAMIKAALDGGINWFDTAELYGAGVSEQSLSAGLKAAGKTDEEVVIATKWFPILRSAGNIQHSIGERLRFLDGYSIANFMVHQPFSFSTPEAEMNAMADLVEAGKIRSVGVSNFNSSRMRRAHAALARRGLPLAVNQVRYSLLHREIESNGVLETARELGVTIVAYTPLGYGLLTGKYHKDPQLIQQARFYRRPGLRASIEHTTQLINVMERIASNYGATLAQVALNWLIHFNGEMVVTIPGATRVSQVQDASGAMKFQLSAQEMALLDDASRGF